MTETLFDLPIIGSVTFSVAAFINILVVRYILQYLRETREEYARRLTKAVIELEVQKTINAKLEFSLDRMRILHPDS
jgi:hypothetical protein